MFRREYRNISGKTEKLFRDIPLSQIGFGTCLIIFGGCQNHSGNFWEFSEMKTGNVPELPEPLQMLFADEITKLELFQNALKIILVGTGNVLSPHKYFQFERTLKNVVMNSESAFWVILGKPPFRAFAKRLLEGHGGHGSPSWGGPQGCGRPREVELLGAPHGIPFCPYYPHVKSFAWEFLVIWEAHYPLGFPINRR